MNHGLSIGAIIEDTTKELPYEELPKFNAIVLQNNIQGSPQAITMNKEIISLMNIIENETKTYQDFCLVLAVDYGGNDELQRAGQELVLASNTSKRIGDYLDTAKVLIPDVDLVVRTGGEKRTSGFLPVQSAYAEWIFDHRLLPDFDKNAFDEVIKEYHTRSRRYGM